MTLFAFLDLETTGLDPDEDHILEIAWLLADSKLNQATHTRTHIVEHSPGAWQDVWAQLMSNEYVRNMHQQSGLYADMRTKSACTLSAIALQFRDDIEEAIAHVEEGPVHLAGLSIDFDRSFLKKDPTWGLFFDNDVLGVSIHHRLLDLSSIKLMLDACGVPWEKAANEGAHRAAYDVDESLRQALIFQRTLGALAIKENN